MTNSILNRDHAMLINAFDVADSDTFADHTANASSYLPQWQATKSGILSYVPVALLGFFRLPETDPIFSKYSDPSAGLTSGHYELILGDTFGITGVPRPPGDHVSIRTQIMSPSSRKIPTYNKRA
jgi:hypothetical protein